LGRVGR